MDLRMHVNTTRPNHGPTYTYTTRTKHGPALYIPVGQTMDLHMHVHTTRPNHGYIYIYIPLGQTVSLETHQNASLPEEEEEEEEEERPACPLSLKRLAQLHPKTMTKITCHLHSVSKTSYKLSKACRAWSSINLFPLFILLSSPDRKNFPVAQQLPSYTKGGPVNPQRTESEGCCLPPPIERRNN